MSQVKEISIKVGGKKAAKGYQNSDCSITLRIALEDETPEQAAVEFTPMAVEMVKATHMSIWKALNFEAPRS